MTIEVKNPNKKIHLDTCVIELISKFGIKIILSLKTLKSWKMVKNKFSLMYQELVTRIYCI